MPQKPLDISTPLFYPRAEEQQHHFRVSSRVMPMPPGYTKVFGFAPTWCTTKQPYGKRKAVFLMIAALWSAFVLPLTWVEVSGSFCFVGEIQELLL